MIFIGIKNGLGNQMFQYVFGKVLEWRYNIPVQFDIMPEDFVSGKRTDMEVFNIEEFHVANKEMIKVFMPFSLGQYKNEKRYLSYIYFKLRRMLHPKKLITERLPSQYCSIIDHLKPSRNYYFMGHWMNMRYFEGYEERISKLFVLKDDSFYSSAIAAEITGSTFTTISLHIRRGDYLTSGFIEATDISYYQHAVSLIRAKVKNPFLFIFTNDEEWAVKEFCPQLDYKIVSVNKGANSYKDMMLMSLCHHNIIANSSFSWWGAWLNKHEDKVVIAPRNWYSDDKTNRYVIDMIPKKWIRI